MSARIGSSGRRAREFARQRMAALRSDEVPATSAAVLAGGLPLLRRAPVISRLSSDEETTSLPAPAPGQAGERETSHPSAEEVADHVYRLFCQDWRRGRERQGGWR